MSHENSLSQASSLISNYPWTAKDLRSSSSQWIHNLKPAEVIEVEQALAKLISCGKPLLQCSPQDFPLPTLHKTLLRAMLICETRTGVALLRNLPVEQLSEADARLLAWGIGMHLGVPLIQNSASQLLVDVRDSATGAQGLRKHTTNAAMEFHVDSSDLATVLCRRAAMQGGQSRIANMLTIHNQMGVENIEWQQALYEPLPFSALADDPDTQDQFFMCPVFSCEHGIFAARFYEQRILACRNFPEAPPLSGVVTDACEAFQRIANDPKNCFEFTLRPGDLQLLNNHVVCHARRSFADHAATDRKRHLFRQWFATPFSRPLPESFREAYGRIEPGSYRGGYKAWTATPEIISCQKTIAEFTGVNF
ncbi:TauD/TfdA family dioxygenase [Pseudomonas sp. G.S.17]|uniref:TauD/TfdA family dioxygenase n=1 Tax=Pseudomonas sp. G.S.17 TaxID=3137451 RepID=UPI00311CCFA2